MRLVLALVISGLISTSAFATTAATEHPGSVPVLLGVQSVRNDLKLTSLQRALLDSMREEYKTDARKLTDPAPATTEQRLAAEKALAGLNERYNKRALATLDKAQLKRFAEIENQILGETKLYSPSVQGKLGLSAQQKGQIESIRQQGLVYVGKINHQFENGKIGYQKRLELLRDKRLSQGVEIRKVLTPEQQKAFDAMGGKKFVI